MNVEILSSDGYELVATGEGRKLERFGDVLLDRPAPQAIWSKGNNPLWKKADARFKRSESGAGNWKIFTKNLPENWSLKWQGLTFEVRLTGFGNVGLFPEHAAHWTWMFEIVTQCKNPEILNLFAYTGGASLTCAEAGAKVTHLDSAKSVNGWAMLNSKLSQVSGGSIRYLADDAMKFIKREQRREHTYEGIIIDPPTYGRGPNGETWKIERDMVSLIDACCTILAHKPLFIVLTSHSPGITPSVLKHLLKNEKGTIESGEMLLKGTDALLPAGVFARWIPA
jgi:23S rRNA (cytosine1962-C5)-methyltransferase